MVTLPCRCHLQQVACFTKTKASDATMVLNSMDVPIARSSLQRSMNEQAPRMAKAAKQAHVDTAEHIKEVLKATGERGEMINGRECHSVIASQDARHNIASKGSSRSQPATSSLNTHSDCVTKSKCTLAVHIATKEPSKRAIENNCHDICCSKSESAGNSEKVLAAKGCKDVAEMGLKIVKVVADQDSTGTFEAMQAVCDDVFGSQAQLENLDCANHVKRKVNSGPLWGPHTKKQCSHRFRERLAALEERARGSDGKCKKSLDEHCRGLLKRMGNALKARMIGEFPLLVSLAGGDCSKAVEVGKNIMDCTQRSSNVLHSQREMPSD